MQHRLVSCDSTVIPIVESPISKVKSPGSLSWIFAKQRLETLAKTAGSLPQHMHTLLPAILFSRDICRRIANRLEMVIPSYVSIVTSFIWAFGGGSFIFWFRTDPAKTLLNGPIV